MKKFLMRVKHERLGAHTHVTFFSGFGERMVEARFSGLGNNGTLVFRNEEWEVVREILGRPTNFNLPDFEVDIVEVKPQDG